VELTVQGKHAHMMVIAWVLGRVYEDNINAPGYPAKRRAGLDWLAFWTYIVERGLFELLRKCVVSDLKSQVWERIVADGEARRKLNEYTLSVLVDCARTGPPSLIGRMRSCADGRESEEERLAWDVLRAASGIATAWEFDLLEPGNAFQAEMERIRDNLRRERLEYQYVPGVRELERPDSGLRAFVDLCGRLRFQERWSTTPVLPRCPVLDHELMVANLTYLVGLERDYPPEQILANYYAGLFHDLGEAMTRDIVRDVKALPDLSDVMAHASDFASREFKDTLTCMLPPAWYQQVEYLAAHGLEDADRPEEPPHLYGPAADGCTDSWPVWQEDVVTGADDFANFVEAASSVDYGVAPPAIRQAVERMMLSKRSAKRLVEFGGAYEELYSGLHEGPWKEVLEAAKVEVEQEQAASSP